MLTLVKVTHLYFPINNSSKYPQYDQQQHINPFELCMQRQTTATATHHSLEIFISTRTARRNPLPYHIEASSRICML